MVKKYAEDTYVCKTYDKYLQAITDIQKMIYTTS